MRKALGYLVLVSLFAVILGGTALESGVFVALKVVVSTVVCLAWVLLGCWLIGGDGK